MSDALNATLTDPVDLAQVHDSACDTWLRTIALLTPQRHTLRQTEESHAPGAHAPIITIVERPSAGRAVVSWRDATHCRYGAQVWLLGAAPRAGVCALSGQPIDKANLVFRPQRARPAALNANAMILVAAMDDACMLNLPAYDDEHPAFRYRADAR